MADARGKLARAARALNAGPLPSLVLMTDDERLSDPGGAASRLPHGSLIVLRARQTKRRRALAAELARIARRRKLFLVIANDADLAASADGLHVPQANLGVLAHWRARRPSWFLTASAHSLFAVQRAAACGADAVFLSPVFPTRSHPGRPALTPIRLRFMAQCACVPIYALGGIDASNVGRLADAKLAGIAAIGALAT